MDEKVKVAPRAYSIGSLISMGFGSRTYLYEQIKAKRLVAKKFGKRTLVLAQDLEEFCRNLPDAAEDFEKQSRERR